MALQRIQITRKIQDTSGSAITGATVTVSTLPDNGTAVIYSNETGTATIVQPLLSDAEGDINGWVELGDYSIFVQSTSGSVTSRFYGLHPKQSFLQTYTPEDSALTVKSNSSQVGDIFEVKDSSDSTIASIGTTGAISSPTITSLNSDVSTLQSNVNSAYGLATALQGSANTLQSSAGSVQTSLSDVAGTVSSLSGTAGSVAFFYNKEVTLGTRLGTVEANNWVTTNRISDGAVTLSKFAAAVGTPEISLLTTQTFTSSQSYILPGSAKIIIVEVTGAGGGGAGGANVYRDGISYFVVQGYGGGGGAGGQTSRQICTRAELSGTVTVTVGSGGSGGGAGGIASTQGEIGNAGGWSQFGPIYVPGARPGSGLTGANQREFGLTFGSGGFGGNGGYSDNSAPASGYRNFRGAAGGGGGAGINHGTNNTTGAAGGKGFDIPSNVWPTTSTPNVTVAQGGATGSAGDGGAGGDVWNGSTGVSGVGSNGVAPGGGGGGGGAGRWDSNPGGAGGSGARGEVKIWVFG